MQQTSGLVEKTAVLGHVPDLEWRQPERTPRIGGAANARSGDGLRDAVERGVISRKFCRGQDILAAGATQLAGFRLRKGWAASYAILADGRRQLIYIYVPGDIVLCNGLRTERADDYLMAITDAEVELLPSVTRQAGHEGEARVLSIWVKSLLDERSIMSERIVSLGRRTAFESAAQLLSELCIRLDLEHWQDRQNTKLPVTQGMLADLLGLSIVHMNRTLGRLRAEGWLATKPGYIEIYKPLELAEAAGLEAA